MSEINAKNKQFAEKEEKENKELENMVDDMGSDREGEEDLFDREMKHEAKDDHKSLKEDMMETYKETMHELNQEDVQVGQEETQPAADDSASSTKNASHG